jgi:hypothetical protein
MRSEIRDEFAADDGDSARHPVAIIRTLDPAELLQRGQGFDDQGRGFRGILETGDSSSSVRAWLPSVSRTAAIY